MNLFDEIREHIANGETEEVLVKVMALEMFVNTADVIFNKGGSDEIGPMLAMASLSHAFTCGCNSAKAERNRAIDDAVKVNDAIREGRPVEVDDFEHVGIYTPLSKQ